MKRPAHLLSLVLFTATIVSTLAYVSARATFLKSVTTQPTADVATQAHVSAPVVPPERGPRQVVQFTLYDAGIYPHEARVDRGIVMFLLEDLAGGTTGLVVVRDNSGTSETVGEVRRAERSWRGRREMRLTPGRYQVYDAARPDHRALLIVEP